MNFNRREGVILNRKLAAALILLAGAGAVCAQEVKVISGAVGLEDRNAMMAEYGQYNLHMAFARNNGEYLAGVKYVIRRPSGAVVYEGTSDGPFVFAKLPTGSYDVSVDSDGRMQKRRINVGGGNKQPMIYFRWS
jgi:hypothetical protein